MHITYCGHACFKIETKPGGHGSLAKRMTIYIDPFSSKIGLKTPFGTADLVLVTHDHSDHNNIRFLKGDYFLINGPGEYTYKGITVYGIRTFHDNEEGKQRGLNTVYLIESEGVRICHLGDLGHLLNKNELGRIGEVDVLMIPTGGLYTIGSKEAVDIIKSIEPKYVIPMHYAREGLKIEGLEKVTDFYNKIGIKPEEAIKRFNIKSSNTEKEEMKVIQFEA